LTDWFVADDWDLGCNAFCDVHLCGTLGSCRFSRMEWMRTPSLTVLTWMLDLNVQIHLNEHGAACAQTTSSPWIWRGFLMLFPRSLGPKLF
jgi:hypothetical protein